MEPPVHLDLDRSNQQTKSGIVSDGYDEDEYEVPVTLPQQ